MMPAMLSISHGDDPSPNQGEARAARAPGPELLDQHDAVEDRVEEQYGDGVPALEYLASDLATPSALE